MPKSEESFIEPPSHPPTFGATPETPPPPDATPGKKKGKVRGRALTEPAVPPSAPPAPQTLERQKTPEVRRAEALSDYFKEVESGTDFLQRIVNMPNDVQLRNSVGFDELIRLSGEISQKVVDFFDLFEVWEKDKKSAKEMVRSREEFIASHTIPSGFQTAFRNTALFAINKILGPVAETLKATSGTKPDTSAPKPPPAGGEKVAATPRAPLTSEEIIAHYKAAKAAVEIKTSSLPGETTRPAAGTATATETPKSAATSEEEAFLERVRARSSRLWNPPRESAPKAPPPAPPRTEVTPPPPISATETPPVAPSKAESAPAPAAAPQASETTETRSPDVILLESLHLTRGTHIKLITTKLGEIYEIEGILDFGPVVGLEISVNNHKNFTSRIKGVYKEGGKIFFRTKNSVYELVK